MKKTLLTAAFILSAVCLFAQTGKWSGSIKVQNSSLMLVFDLGEGNEATLDVPDQHVKGIKTNVTRGEYGNISLFVPALNATYEGVWLGNMISGKFSQNGVELPLTLKPGVPVLNRPQTPKAPFPYDTEEVSFANGDAVLKGTLTLPENCDRGTPVLLMITGSGLQNRDEEVFEHKPFAVIADALAKAGIASLRYDDRGFGESTGDIVNSTVEDFKNDALAGITLLRERFDKVGVLGHSEGGSFALLLAADSKVDFVVSLAGLVVSMKGTLLRQNREALQKAGISEEQTSAYVKLLSEAFDAVCQGATPPSADGLAIPDGLKTNYAMVLKQISMPYMKSSLAMDPREVLGDVRCPVLALNGTKDTQVDCEENLGALENGLKEGLNAVRVEGVNHLFQHCTTGEVSEYKEIEETFSPEVLADIIKWVNSQK